jgi:cytosine/adenosine deaminase-related metal-dependent hydrolase
VNDETKLRILTAVKDGNYLLSTITKRYFNMDDQEARHSNPTFKKRYNQTKKHVRELEELGILQTRGTTIPMTSITKRGIRELNRISQKYGNPIGPWITPEVGYS